jgi:hypothetical protein
MKRTFIRAFPIPPAAELMQTYIEFIVDFVSCCLQTRNETILPRLLLRNMSFELLHRRQYELIIHGYGQQLFNLINDTIESHLHVQSDNLTVSSHSDIFSTSSENWFYFCRNINTIRSILMAVEDWCKRQNPVIEMNVRWLQLFDKIVLCPHANELLNALPEDSPNLQRDIDFIAYILRTIKSPPRLFTLCRNAIHKRVSNFDVLSAVLPDEIINELKSHW